MPRILIVDEDEVESYIYAHLLRTAGFDVVSVDSPVSALDKLTDDAEFDAAFIDSFELKKLDTSRFPIPIIVLAYSETDSGNDKPQNIIGYISYPVNVHSLAENIRAAINAHREK